MILYRAMCKDELDKTLNSSSLSWHRNKEKCFSLSTNFIINRVQDGNFNNSKFKPERYEYLVKFVFNDDDKSKFIFCRREVKTYSKYNPKPIKIEVL
jgi:hypothetical protein